MGIMLAMQRRFSGLLLHAAKIWPFFLDLDCAVLHVCTSILVLFKTTTPLGCLLGYDRLRHKLATIPVFPERLLSVPTT